VLAFATGKRELQEIRWQLAAAWVLGSALHWWTCARLKRVELRRTILVISNYRDDITVDVADIARVTQNRLINLRPITLLLSKDTMFGRKIMFIPPMSFRLFAEDQIVSKLRRLAEIRRSSG